MISRGKPMRNTEPTSSGGGGPASAKTNGNDGREPPSPGPRSSSLARGAASFQQVVLGGKHGPPVCPPASLAETTAADRSSDLSFGLEDLAALVHTGLEIDVVRTAQLAGILVL